ncbi:MAG: hypothetical protein ACOX1V_03890 [Candidatus Iainarchaeum sp.]|mgnify:CR=1 FL=1|nr:MAG: hypothetical protein BWY55_00788 [archaeon ADurb.Bin336]
MQPKQMQNRQKIMAQMARQKTATGKTAKPSTQAPWMKKMQAGKKAQK